MLPDAAAAVAVKQIAHHMDPALPKEVLPGSNDTTASIVSNGNMSGGSRQPMGAFVCSMVVEMYKSAEVRGRGEG